MSDPFDPDTFCCACVEPTIQRVVLPPQRDRVQRILFRCEVCGAERPFPVTHFAYQMRCTACCLELDGSRYLTTLDPRRVDCADCLHMLFTEIGETPTPDWRSPFSIPEDHYAI